MTPPILGGSILGVKQYRTTNPEEYHVAESDRRPGESERDWMRRIAKQGADAAQRRKDQDRQNSLDRQAEEAEIRAALSDEVWLADATRSLLGMTPDEVDAAMAAGTKSTNWDQKDQAAMDAWEKAKKKRLLEGKKARNKRVAKHVRENKGKIQRATKKGKNGCAVIAVALLATGGGVLYGIFEAGRTVLSALGH